ncbi:MAG: hypothetical protein JWO02_955, partial [Solirubrobacterales bacterium]|nr:hypothetical protein [Solirubrobacterales bacterium]
RRRRVLRRLSALRARRTRRGAPWRPSPAAFAPLALVALAVGAWRAGAAEGRSSRLIGLVTTALPVAVAAAHRAVMPVAAARGAVMAVAVVARRRRVPTLSTRQGLAAGSHGRSRRRLGPRAARRVSRDADDQRDGDSDEDGAGDEDAARTPIEKVSQ